MLESLSKPGVVTLAVFVGLVAAGVAVHGAVTSPVRTLPALALTCVGLYGVARVAGGRSVEQLRFDAKRSWLFAVAAVIPYGLATAPSNERAAATGEAFSGPVAGLATEAVAGAVLLCAVTITVVYAIAVYGVHPGRPTPEERVLNEEWND